MPTATSSRTVPDVRRFELKYRLDLSTYQRLRCALRRFARHDHFSEAGRDRRYFVRSLYFDTYDYLAYEEKITGVANRIKLRIRSYWPTRAAARFVTLELKTKTGALVGKLAQRITLDEYDHFLTTRAWPQPLGPVADEFRRLLLLRVQQPRVIVDYDREALVPLDRSDVRITFDHGMRFAAATGLFPTRPFFHAERPQCVVLEIKYRTAQPVWLERLCRQYGLSSAPNSKYARGIEQTQHAIYR